MTLNRLQQLAGIKLSEIKITPQGGDKIKATKDFGALLIHDFGDLGEIYRGKINSMFGEAEFEFYEDGDQSPEPFMRELANRKIAYTTHGNNIYRTVTIDMKHFDIEDSLWEIKITPNRQSLYDFLVSNFEELKSTIKSHELLKIFTHADELEVDKMMDDPKYDVVRLNDSSGYFTFSDNRSTLVDPEDEDDEDGTVQELTISGRTFYAVYYF